MSRKRQNLMCSKLSPMTPPPSNSLLFTLKLCLQSSSCSSLHPAPRHPRPGTNTCPPIRPLSAKQGPRGGRTCFSAWRLGECQSTAPQGPRPLLWARMGWTLLVVTRLPLRVLRLKPARPQTGEEGGTMGHVTPPPPSLTRRNQLQISLFFSWGKNRFGQLRPTEGRSSYASASHPRRGGLSHGWEGSRRHHLGDLGEKLQVLDFSRVTGD